MNLLRIITVFCLIGFSFGCSSMLDVHADFVKDGETVYSVKATDVKAFPGYQRVKITGELINALQVKKIQVNWENSDKTISTEEFEYDYNQSPDVFEVVLPVSEGQYIFNIISVTQKGDFSIPSEIYSKIYGEKYIGYLVNREITSMLPNSSGGVKFTFAPSVENHTSMELVYTTMEGSQKEIVIPRGQDELVIEDLDISKSAYYKSGYLPDEKAIDILFCTEEEISFETLSDISFKFDKTEWSILDYSSQEDPANEGGINGPAGNIIDGSLSSYWQSQWMGNVGQIPHHIVLDMNRDYLVENIQLFRRSGNNHTKTVVLEGSLDGSSWEKIGDLNYSDNKEENSQELELQKGKRYRYLKINVTESNAPPYVSLSEIIAVGKL